MKRKMVSLDQSSGEEDEVYSFKDHSSSSENSSSQHLVPKSENLMAKPSSKRFLTKEMVSKLSSAIGQHSIKIGEVDEEAYIIEATIDHIKMLQSQVNLVEKEAKNEIIVPPTVNNIVSAVYDGGVGNRDIPLVKVTIKEKNVKIQVHCKRGVFCMSKISDEIEKFDLSMVNMSSFPFEDNYVDITIMAKVQNESWMEVEELIRKVELILKTE